MHNARTCTQVLVHAGQGGIRQLSVTRNWKYLGIVSILGKAVPRYVCLEREGPLLPINAMALNDDQS